MDVLFLLTVKIGNTSSLLHWLEACEIARQDVEQLSRSITSALLNTFALEMRQMAVVSLALESTKLSDSTERASFINIYLGHTDESSPTLSNPVKSFGQLRDIAAAVETFTPLYIAACIESLERSEAAILKSIGAVKMALAFRICR